MGYKKYKYSLCFSSRNIKYRWMAGYRREKKNYKRGERARVGFKLKDR